MKYFIFDIIACPRQYQSVVDRWFELEGGKRMSDTLAVFKAAVLRSLRRKDFVNEYRIRNPSTAMRIDSGSSPTAALALKCRE